MTFGFKRAEILSAQFNGATLLVLALLIVYEAIHRLITPPDVGGMAVWWWRWSGSRSTWRRPTRSRRPTGNR